ncbi:MAG: UbiA family prenyltransferase [Propionibacteriaceae bacterium]
MTRSRTLAPWLRACHPGPTGAVTLLTLLLALAAGLPWARSIPLVLTVLAGQLTIGWSNDLLDRDRDRMAGRGDKPLVTQQLEVCTVRVSILVAGLVCLGASVFIGYAAALVHLVAVVGAGWAYNLVLKRTLVSFVPYALAFGALPCVVSLADRPAGIAPAWMVAAGALLGVSAHLANALPDLDDDTATGVTGLPQRLGSGMVRLCTPLILVAGSLLAALGPSGRPPAWVWLGLVAIAILTLVAWVGHGKTPFRAVIAIALVNVALLVARGATR